MSFSPPRSGWGANQGAKGDAESMSRPKIVMRRSSPYRLHRVNFVYPPRYGESGEQIYNLRPDFALKGICEAKEHTFSGVNPDGQFAKNQD